MSAVRAFSGRWNGRFGAESSEQEIFHKPPEDERVIAEVHCGTQSFLAEGKVWLDVQAPIKGREDLKWLGYAMRDENGFPLYFGLLAKGNAALRGLGQSVPLEAMQSWRKRQMLIGIGASVLYFAYATGVVIYESFKLWFETWTVPVALITAFVTALVVQVRVLAGAKKATRITLNCRMGQECNGYHACMVTNSTEYPFFEQAADLGLPVGVDLFAGAQAALRPAEAEQRRMLAEKYIDTAAALEQERAGRGAVFTQVEYGIGAQGMGGARRVPWALVGLGVLAVAAVVWLVWQNSGSL